MLQSNENRILCDFVAECTPAMDSDRDQSVNNYYDIIYYTLNNSKIKKVQFVFRGSLFYYGRVFIYTSISNQKVHKIIINNSIEYSFILKSYFLVNYFPPILEASDSLNSEMLIDPLRQIALSNGIFRLKKMEQLVK